MTDTTGVPLFFRLRVKAIEDLHVGAGSGGGDIDALVLRDRQGRPVIRASHLKGLLRQAGEELIALGKATQEDLDALLGEAGSRRGALRLTSLSATQDAATLVWGSSARVAYGRAPLPDTLRYIEHVAAGAQFEATLRLAEPARKGLLDKLLGRVDRIGGGRNRGGGLVQLTWEELTREQVTWKDKAATTSTKNACNQVTGSCLRLILRNLEPLCLPATGHPGNLIRSHSFIRGQTLRGALIAWVIHHSQGQQRLQETLALFQHLSVGDALPLPPDLLSAEEVVPIPLSILTEKPAGGVAHLPWWAAGSKAPTSFNSLHTERDPKAEKPKRPGAHEYLCRASAADPWRRYTPELIVRLRNATPKRGTKADAELYSLEEIAEETRFQAELCFDGEDIREKFIKAFAPLLNGGDWLAIGRGGIPVVIAATGSLTRLQPGAGQGARQHGFPDDWTLTLTSDLIARGPQLGFLDDLDIPSLCKLAGIEKLTECDWKIQGRVTETERLHGFNAVTGLQRAPALVLRRGSCWRITGSGSADLAKALINKAPLGERTREGLGRIRVDIQPITKFVRGKGQARTPATNRGEVLLARARELAGMIQGNGPSLSQLQWLREQALAANDASDLADLLKKILEAPTRRPQGGKAWAAFPTTPLQEQFALLEREHPGDSKAVLTEKRQLISYLVQWRVPVAKENRR